MSVSAADNSYSAGMYTNSASSVQSSSDAFDFASLLGTSDAEETANVLSALMQSGLSLTGDGSSSSGFGDMLSMLMMYSMFTRLQESMTAAGSAETSSSSSYLCSACEAAYSAGSTADTEETVSLDAAG